MIAAKSKQLLTAVIVLLLLGFALYSNVRRAIENYQLQQKIERVNADVEQLKIRNEKLKLVLTYYQTTSYQEVEARRRLQLKRPEETVLAVKGLNLTPSEMNALEEVVYQEAPPAKEEPKTNIEKWKEYLFK